jgi:CRISPR-associated endonuclease Csn1
MLWGFSFFIGLYMTNNALFNTEINQSHQQSNPNNQAIPYEYRLGLDLGTSSIGWAITRFQRQENAPSTYAGVVAMGSRIFSDSRQPSKTGGLGDSLAVRRREARQARRQIDRKKGRRMALVYALRAIGLMPEIDTELGKQQNKNLQKRNPYKLRHDGVLEQITPHELGRAIFHLQKRRGFKSSRKDLQKNAEKNEKADESSAVKQTIKNLKNKITEAGYQTAGQYLYQKCCLQGKTPLCKKVYATKKTGEIDTAKISSYENYFDRSMIIDEFNTLWNKQRPFYPKLLTEENRQKIFEIIFFQRPLKDPAVGFCTYIAGENRASMCLPTSELYRVWQDVGNLEIRLAIKPKKSKKNATSLSGNEENTYKLSNEQKTLSLIEKQALVAMLCDKEQLNADNTISFTALMKELAKLRGDADLAKNCKFNFDTAKKEKLLGAQSIAQLTVLINKHLPAAQAQTLLNDVPLLDKLTQLINQEKSALPPELQTKVKQTARLDIDKLEAIFTEAIYSTLEGYHLSTELIDDLNQIELRDDYTSVSQKAMQQMLIHMQQGKSQFEAREACGFKDHHYDNPQGIQKLPYYGEILKNYCVPQTNLQHLLTNPKLHPQTRQEIELGKIGNPSVHVALNELRKVVNELLKKYAKCFKHNAGKPDAIHIELGRDLTMGGKKLDALIKKQNDNEKYKQLLKDELRQLGILPTHDALEKLRYYKMLQDGLNMCIYTCQPLPASFLEVNQHWEVDHILPISRSFDDGRGNKILISRRANQEKKERTPWEYMQQDHYDEINAFKARVAQLPEWQQWRFLEKGVEYLNSSERDPNARLLSATQYMVKVARIYLQALYNEHDAAGKYIRNNCVLAVPSGKITAHIRREWKLDSLLWSAEQLSIQKQIKEQIEPLEIRDQEGSNPLHEAEMLRLEFLKDLANVPMDLKIWQTLEQEYQALVEKAVNNGLVDEKAYKEAGKKVDELRKKLKNRNDHRHHALDAAILTFATPSIIQRRSILNKYTQQPEKVRLLVERPSQLYADLTNKITQIVVSHKPDHCTATQLHEESARFKIYVGQEVKYTYNKKQYLSDGVPQDAVSESSVIGIKRNSKDESSVPYKYYKTGSNYCMEIYEEKAGKYAGDVITSYTANQKAYQAFMGGSSFKNHTFSGRKLILRIIAGDMLKVHVPIEVSNSNENEQASLEQTQPKTMIKYVYIQKFGQSGIFFNEHFEANCDARNRAKIKGDAFVMQLATPNSLINKYQPEKIFVTPIGQVIVLAK